MRCLSLRASGRRPASRARPRAASCSRAAMKADTGSCQASVTPASASSSTPLDDQDRGHEAQHRAEPAISGSARTAAYGPVSAGGWRRAVPCGRPSRSRTITTGGRPQHRWRSRCPRSRTPSPCASIPSADELKELAAKMPNARRTKYDNLNVQTEVLARSKASTFLVLDDPDSQLAAGHLARGGRAHRPAPGRLHRRPRHDRRRRLHRQRPRVPHARAPLHRGGEREHRRDAEAALLRRRRPRRLRARAHRHLHAQPRGRGLPERPRDRGRPRARRHARLQLRLLRRVEEGRAAHVEQARLRPRRPAAARRLQGHPDRLGRQGRPDRRPLRAPARPPPPSRARTARCRCRTTSWR